MPYKIDYIEDEGGVIIAYSGTVTDQDVVQSVKEVFSSDDKTRTYRYVIPDFSAGEKSEISADGIRENALVVLEASKVSKRIIMAIVIPSSFRVHMPRLWQTYMNKTGWRIKNVRSISYAKRWIKLF